MSETNPDIVLPIPFGTAGEMTKILGQVIFAAAGIALILVVAEIIFLKDHAQRTEGIDMKV